MHRDIKPQNILFKEFANLNTLKLIDFGLSAKFDDINKTSRPLGTAIYLAPEIITTQYDEKVDIWSLGVMLYQLVAGTPPFMGNNTRELYEAI